MLTKFETGKTYETRSACDYGCVFSVTVTRRTAKSVWVRVKGEEKRCKVTEYDGAETIKPFGSYSMAPIFRA